MAKSMDKSVNMKKVIASLSVAGLFMSGCVSTDESTASRDQELGYELSNIDSSAKPCNDFFQYVAGGWIENHPIPETESRWGNFNLLRERNKEKLKFILDSVSDLEGLEAGSYPQLVQAYYRSGMDSAAVDKNSLNDLQPALAQAETITSVEDYRGFFNEASQNGWSLPLSVGVTVDDRNSNKYVVGISQSGLGLPDRSYYLGTDSANRKIQDQYRQHMATMLELSGWDPAKAETAAADIYEFEKMLARHSMSRVDRRKPELTYNKLSRQQIVDATGTLGLAEVFETEGWQFDSAVVNQPAYMQKLDSLVSAAEPQTLANYQRWHLLHQNADYLPAAFVEEDFAFYGKTMEGRNKMKPRWKRVLSKLTRGLGEQLGHMYVDRYFAAESKETVEQMVEDLRDAYADRIEKLEWMSDSTKMRAKDKLAAFTYKIGYPDEWKDFSDLRLEDGKYLQNAMKLRRYLTERNSKKLGKPVDKKEWFMPPHMVNAYYNPSFNEVVFPAGILQPPFYDPNAAPAVNYGAIGGVIGHEFTHGFDDQGSKYDGEGNLNDWWTKKDRKRFNQRARKLVDLYSSYEPVEGAHVNGELTLGENIADLGGLTLAYHAYEKSIDRRGGTPEVIDGFTWQQRIFLGWGQVWASNQKEAYTRKQVKTDPHSPAEYRVNGTVTNMPEFRKAWNCEADHALVPSDSTKVTIW